MSPGMHIGYLGERSGNNGIEFCDLFKIPGFHAVFSLVGMSRKASGTSLVPGNVGSEIQPHLERRRTMKCSSLLRIFAMKIHTQPVVKYAAALAILSALVNPPLLCQIYTGFISGTVVDPSGTA